MEEAIKMQEEFENLIKELERLKNINELTSANTENAHSVISNIESFIQSTSDFKILIEQDINHKSISIQQLIDELKVAINSFGNQSEKIQRELNSSTNSIKTDANGRFSKIDSSLKLQIENIYNETESLKNLFSSKLSETHSYINQSLNEYSEKHQLKLSKETEVLRTIIQTQGQEIKSLKTVMIIIGALIVIGTILTIFIK